ncbi:MAG: hypothetical protein ACI3XM_02775 [Eubacteriales bacterium]
MIQTDNPRSLPGFKKKSFSMAFHGGEIWFEHLDGIYGYEELVLEKLKNDSAVFCRPSCSSFICVNFDETELTDTIIDTLCSTLLHANKAFRRVCFVGVDKAHGRKIRKILDNNGFPIAFIDDFEKAKEWLIP